MTNLEKQKTLLDQNRAYIPQSVKQAKKSNQAKPKTLTKCGFAVVACVIIISVLPEQQKTAIEPGKFPQFVLKVNEQYSRNPPSALFSPKIGISSSEQCFCFYLHICRRDF